VRHVSTPSLSPLPLLSAHASLGPAVRERRRSGSACSGSVLPFLASCSCLPSLLPSCLFFLFHFECGPWGVHAPVWVLHRPQSISWHGPNQGWFFPGVQPLKRYFLPPVWNITFQGCFSSPGLNYVPSPQAFSCVFSCTSCPSSYGPFHMIFWRCWCPKDWLQEKVTALEL